MSILDGFKLGIGATLGYAFMVVLVKELTKACDKGIEILKEKEAEAKENE